MVGINRWGKRIIKKRNWIGKMKWMILMVERITELFDSLGK
jgi:hypothetical protein